MESSLPPGLASEMEVARRNRTRRKGRYAVLAGDRRHPLMILTADGFAIEADGRPPLRGYVDILEGETRIDRRLVVCSWAEDGLVGYEFKRESAIGGVPADHVAPVHAGLLGAPD